MRSVLAVIVFILGILLAAYAGGWLMFIKPIIECCKAFDAGTLTGLIVGVTVLKCVFAGAVASFIVWVCSVIAAMISD